MGRFLFRHRPEAFHATHKVPAGQDGKMAAANHSREADVQTGGANDDHFDHALRLARF
jgi:hypothetical protein